MNERINKLRKQSTGIRPSISAERALLVTEFYKSDIAQKVSIPVKRAMTFKYILENKKICINEGELIVGERGPAPQSCPTYPEICVHSQDDFEILHSREKVPFISDAETRKYFDTVIAPFWKGNTIREKMFNELPEEWKDAYKSGVFTEFMEQRPPGHTVLDDKIYRKGMNDFISDIQRSLKNLDFCNDPEAFTKKEELNAMEIAAEALIFFAGKYASELKRLASIGN